MLLFPSKKQTKQGASIANGVVGMLHEQVHQLSMPRGHPVPHHRHQKYLLLVQFNFSSVLFSNPISTFAAAARAHIVSSTPGNRGAQHAARQTGEREQEQDGTVLTVAGKGARAWGAVAG